MYQNYMNKPAFMSNTASTGFGATSSSTFGQPAASTSMFSSMQPSNSIFPAASTSSFNAGPSTQSSFAVKKKPEKNAPKIALTDEPPKLDLSLLKFTGGGSSSGRVDPAPVPIIKTETFPLTVPPLPLKSGIKEQGKLGGSHSCTNLSPRSQPGPSGMPPARQVSANASTANPFIPTKTSLDLSQDNDDDATIKELSSDDSTISTPSMSPRLPHIQIPPLKLDSGKSDAGTSRKSDHPGIQYSTSFASLYKELQSDLQKDLDDDDPMPGPSDPRSKSSSMHHQEILPVPASVTPFTLPSQTRTPMLNRQLTTYLNSVSGLKPAFPVTSGSQTPANTITTASSTKKQPSPDGPAFGPQPFKIQVLSPLTVNPVYPPKFASGHSPFKFSSNLFGQQPQPSTSGLFGGTNAFVQNKTTFGFGSTPAQSTGLFGQQPQPQTGTGLFQSSTPNLFGSSNTFGNQTGTVIKFTPVTGNDTMQKNGATTPINTKHHCITCMKEYENKSLEELRFEDYSCNRKGPQQQTSFGTPPFGAATSATTTSLFGQTDNKQSFGQPQGFGQTPAFGQTTPAFGVPNQTNTSSLFGKPNTFSATTSTAPTFGFNATPATSNPFSANQAAKPFTQPLFGATTTQAQPTFGGGVFGQPNTQNTTTNLFQKPAQPTTGFNTAQPGFSFNQPATTQSSNLFQVSKPSTGFGMFGQTNTTPGFGQTTQPNFGTNFGKITQPTFTQFSQPSFGGDMSGGMQQPSLFGNTTSKPPSLFGNTTGGGSLFSNNVFQQPQTSFSLNMNQQQPTQFPPEHSDDSKNLPMMATDIFPDGPHIYGLEPVLSSGKNTTTNPQDIKAVLDYSKKRDEMLGTRIKIKVQPPTPRRGTSFNKEFFETNQNFKNSPKCLVIRKFNDNSSSIYNKYNNELLEEAEECMKAQSDAETTSLVSAKSNPTETRESSERVIELPKGRRLNLRLQFDSTLGEEDDGQVYTDSSKTTLDSRSTKSTSTKPTPVVNGNTIGIDDEETPIVENTIESPVTSSTTNDQENVDNPAGVILTKPEYYMYPAMKDLHQYMDENGECIVQGLTIGRRGYGNVYFPDPINITNMNLDEIVHFRHREVIIYADDASKPPVGEGLNRRAQVTLDKIFPREKGTNSYITDVGQIIQTNFVENLMHVTQKHNSKFVDYRPKTGSWVFKVKHFSKYAFTDSDEEECEVSAETAAAKKAQTALKKLEATTEIEEIPSAGLGGGAKPKSRTIHKESDTLLVDNSMLDYWREQHYMLEDTFHDSAIQTLKSSLFTNLDTIEEKKPAEVAVIKKQEVPCEVISTPRVHKLPDISIAVSSEKIMTTQRCYTELGIFRCNTFKIGWSKGFNFYNFDPFAENEVVYALTHCRMNVESSEYYNAMMPSLTDMLQITLEESDFVFDRNQIPTLRIKQRPNYLQRQTNLFNDHVKNQTLTGKEKYLSSVWNLCSALWGPGDDHPCSRRQYLSDWLKKFSYSLSDEWSMDERSDSIENEAFKTIFKLLTFYKISEASEFASRHNLNQLSLLISQMSANERVKHWMRKYKDNFVWKEKGMIIDDYKKLYLLLSGIPVNETINTCDDLDWMRCFGLHLWYIAPSAAPINVAFNSYKKAFEELEYAAKPIPPYCDSESSTKEYDLLYHIIGLYVDSTYQLCKVLHPETHTENIMDYRFSWFMLQLFRSLNVGLIRDSEKEHLHTTFSTQLENMGLWKWAIFVLLFLENNVLKKNLITKILDRNLTTFAETSQIENELVKTFKIPKSWIHEVKAIKAKLGGHHYDYFYHSLYMEDWKQANNTFVEYILPELFINEQFEYLTNFIKKLEPFSNSFMNWNMQAGLIKEYLDLQDALSGQKEEGMASIGGKLSSLFRRINCFPATNDQQKLCVAELSRKCALLFKIIYKNLDSHSYQSKFVDVLSNLVMPPDIKHYEIFYLISKYVQQNSQVH